MRILMISDVYFPRINGVSTSIQTFRRELHRQGVEITLIAPDYGQADSGDADILRVPARRLPLDPEDRFMSPNHIRSLWPRLRRRGFDLVHIQTPFVAHHAGVRIARALELPCIESYHTFFEEYLYHYVPFAPKQAMRYLARRLSRVQCNAVQALVVPSSAMEETLRGYGVRVPTTIIPTGIELQHFERADGRRFRRRHGIPEHRPTLVHVGRVAFEKNIGFLLKVVAELRRSVPEVLLVIAGEGPARRALQREAATLGLEQHTLFVGYQSRNGELQDCYAAGDAFVFASRTETQGLVLLEAMALGVPVVSTAHMGTRDVLQPGCGALLADDNVQHFATQVRRLLHDGELRRRLGDVGRAYARHWTAEALAGRKAALYREVAERTAPKDFIGSGE